MILNIIDMILVKHIPKIRNFDGKRCLKDILILWRIYEDIYERSKFEWDYILAGYCEFIYQKQWFRSKNVNKSKWTWMMRYRYFCWWKKFNVYGKRIDIETFASWKIINVYAVIRIHTCEWNVFIKNILNKNNYLHILKYNF